MTEEASAKEGITIFPCKIDNPKSIHYIYVCIFTTKGVLTIAVTSKDIAKACGVSQGTVDRAFNNRPGINAQTRQKILETAEKMGYRPHLLARSLVTGKTMTIGLVVFDLYNRFFSELVTAIELNARKQGYFTNLTLTHKNKEEEKNCIEHLMAMRVDGLILCSVNGGSEFIKYLKQLNIPIVTIGNRVAEHFTFVGIDDYQSMFDATTHIIQKGYKRVVYVSPPLAKTGTTNLYAQEQRLAGHIAAMDKYKTSCDSVIIKSSDYLAKIDALQPIKAIKTAILCSSDIYALDIMDHFRKMQLFVPEDVGLMGFDNIDVLQYIQPALTTVDYPIEEVGSMAVKTLLSLIENEGTPKDAIIHHKIIEGLTL